MSNVFEGTSVKRYAIRQRKEFLDPWEYTADREYDTLEEAQAALEELTGTCEIVEKFPVLRFVPEKASDSALLRNVLAEYHFKRYMLQQSNRWREWESRYDLQFDTPEDAQAVCRGLNRGSSAGPLYPHFRVATATVAIEYRPLEVSDGESGDEDAADEGE